MICQQLYLWKKSCRCDKKQRIKKLLILFVLGVFWCPNISAYDVSAYDVIHRSCGGSEDNGQPIEKCK
jgi:hypothetical protein